MARENVLAWLEALENQRRGLKMSLEVLADLADLSRATVIRILKKKQTSSSLENVVALSRALGVKVKICVTDPEEYVEEAVQKRAKKIVRMTQGTMALEGQGITDAKFLDHLHETAAKEIRTKPRKELWVAPCRSSSQSQAKRRLKSSLS